MRKKRIVWMMPQDLKIPKVCPAKENSNFPNRKRQFQINPFRPGPNRAIFFNTSLHPELSFEKMPSPSWKRPEDEVEKMIPGPAF
jgi:hypothetical protein